MIIAAGVAATAQRGTATLERPAPSALRFVEVYRGNGLGGPTNIIGTVIDIRQVPVAKVKVRLRDLNTGETVATGESDDNGDYVFPDVEPGTYIVEMFIADRYVMAVSNVGSLGRYETMQTVVQLPGRWDSFRQEILPVQNPGAFVGLSSQATMAGSTIAVAQGQDVPPANPGEPVSP